MRGMSTKLSDWLTQKASPGVYLGAVGGIALSISLFFTRGQNWWVSMGIGIVSGWAAMAAIWLLFGRWQPHADPTSRDDPQPSAVGEVKPGPTSYIGFLQICLAASIICPIVGLLADITHNSGLAQVLLPSRVLAILVAFVAIIARMFVRWTQKLDRYR
jgi:hypothetical protein